MTAKLFETALGIAEPWSVASVDFDKATKVLTISIWPAQGFLDHS
jgi:transposase